jgi:TfoX/Sxy family transcriptional regulator of competence genes
MAYSQSLADRMRRILGRQRGIIEKKMFGGVGLLLNGNMCVGVWKTSLIVRIEPERASDALQQPHAREFDVTGRPMKGWLLIEAEGVDDDAQLATWIQQAVEFVRTLPAKKSKP